MKKIFLLLLLCTTTLFSQRLILQDDDVNTVAGLQWNQTTDTYVRLGTAKGKTRTFFDNQVPWKNIRRCNLSDAGVVNAYYGDVGYIENGSNGQVMVEITKFYYQTVILANGYQWYVSAKIGRAHV